ncbi:hypothetical protein PRIC1_010847 [Phytophthora ramorum]
MESSGSGEDGSVYDTTAPFAYHQDSEEEACGLADAFLQFEAQAEERTLELLKATDAHLFQVPQCAAEPAEEQEEAEEGSFPAYVYMSDQFRLKKPPQFQHWQQNFQYLQIAGSRMLSGESLEHIQMLSTEKNESRVGGGSDEGGESLLQVEGRMCLQEPTRESKRVYEEIILCDGLMEETLAYDGNTDDGESIHGKFSPRAAHVEEVLDALATECFSTTVAPVLTSFYRSMLEQQQLTVRTAREEREAAANRTIEEQIALDKARQLLLERETQEEEARVEALERERQEEEQKEVERRELLLKQQLEENDEEEVKIKTLAYSHTREWYQPNKKCFSHRGRQLTYLKPVLQAKESEEVLVPNTQEGSPPASIDQTRTRQSNVLKKSLSKLQKSHPEWVTGGALTNDKLCDISWVRKIARPPVSPPPSPLRNGSRRRRKNEDQKDDATSSAGVQLPLIARPGAKPATENSLPSAPVRKRSAVNGAG